MSKLTKIWFGAYNKVSCSLATLKKIKPYLKQDCLIIIYNSIIEPYFNYCCLVWDGINDTLKDKLQKLQNRAARIITGAPYLSVPTKEIFKRLNWKSLENKRLDQKAIMMFKIMNGLAPSYLSEIFHNNPGTDTYHLRCSSANLKLPKVRTEIYKRGFTYSAAKLWNSLPDSLKNESSLISFKKKVKKLDLCSEYVK